MNRALGHRAVSPHGRYVVGPAVGLVAAGGLVWALALARILAQDLHLTLTTRWVGTALLALFGALAAVAVHRVVTRRGAHPVWFLPLFLPLVDLLHRSARPWRGPVLLVGALVCALAIAIRASKWRWFLLSLLIPFLVYLPDISPYVGRADTFEFQVIGPQLGVAHPSGYPLYTLVCKLFSLLPMGAIAWRINLSSATFAALAAGFLFLALMALVESDRASRWNAPLAFAVAMLLAFSPTFWARAIEAEVYTLNGLLVALVLWVTVHWQRGTLGPERAWPALGLLVGLALASHITLGALGFVAAAGLLAKLRRPGRRAWSWALLLGLLGVALYAYIPLRWPAVTGGERMSLIAFWRFVTNAGSGGALRPGAFYQDLSRWPLVGERLLAQVGWPGLALAVAGLVALAWQIPVLAVGSALAFVAWIWFNLSFYVADPDYSAFLIPAHVLLIFWVGCGAQSAVHVLRRRAGQRARLRAKVGPLGFTFLALLPLSRLWQTGPTLDTLSQGRADELWGRYVLQLPFADGAAILADSEKFPPLYYLQQAAGLRPDLELVTLFNEAQYRADLTARLSAGQRVYLARYLPGMDAFGVSAVGPLVAVAPPSLAGVEAPNGVPFGEDLVLTAHHLHADPEGRPRHHLTLAWGVAATPGEDLEVRLRLVDPATDAVVWRADATRPVGGYTTTTAWQPGWQVDDYHALVWPAWLSPATYRLEVALFPRFAEEGLPVGGGDGVWHPLDRVTVPAQPASTLPTRIDALYGDVWLVGVGAPAEVAAGRTLALDLAWICDGGDARALPDLEIAWAPPASAGLGEAVAKTRVALDFCADAAIPMPALRRYEVPSPSQPGRYRLELRAGDGLQVARCGWLQPQTAGCALVDVTVGPAETGLATFGDKIVLLDARVDASGVSAGGPLIAELTWRARQRLERDYTVFVQVIGPDGRLYGQVDSWPVQGTYPTSAWDAGETVVDPYRFFVDADAPPGDYRVIVGWYLLADMTRLPVIDAAGREVGDHWSIGSFVN
jgi:hypothetical protein